MDMILRQAFNKLNEGDTIGYNKHSYMRIGMCLVDLETDECLMYGIDF